MKKILALAAAASAALALSCRPETHEEDPGILAYAVCEMDIHPGSKAKAVGMAGDSQAVRLLSVYGSSISGEIDSVYIMGHVECMEYYFFGSGQEGIFARDTVNHTFSFMHDAVINFSKFEYPEGEPVGVPGTESLGWLACYIEPVFRAFYDTVRECYVDPSLDDRYILPHLSNCRHDTLGYIPRDMMARNRERLLQLMAEQRFQEMIDLYKSEYRIYTCTGEEYRDIVHRRQGAAQ